MTWASVLVLVGLDHYLTPQDGDDTKCLVLVLVGTYSRVLYYFLPAKHLSLPCPVPYFGSVSFE